MVSAQGTHAQRRIVYCSVETQHGRGFGELATVEQPSWGDPSTNETVSYLIATAIPRLLEASKARDGGALASYLVGPLLGGSRIGNAAASLIEMALLDAELRCSSMNLASWLGVEHASVRRGATIGGASIAELEVAAYRALEAGAQRLRAKVDPERAFASGAALRNMAGDQIAVQLDANGSFDLSGSSIEILRSLEALDIACLEQPLIGADLAAMAQLHSLISIPLCLDETVASLRTITDVARYGAANAVCIKPVRFGGVRGAVAAIEQANAGHLSCFIGGMFESGLGRSLIQALAGLPSVDMVSDTAPADTYLEQDPCALTPSASGEPLLWSHLGVGPWPDEAQLTPIAVFSPG